MSLSTLYDEDTNPTPLMHEFLKDISESGIYDVMKKYRELLPPHEVVGFITSDLHQKSAIQTIHKRLLRSQVK